MKTLHAMIAEKRRLEMDVLKAEKAVLLQSIRIWKKYQVWMDNAKPIDSQLAQNTPDDNDPTCGAEAVRLVVNGEPLDGAQVFAKIKQKFPQLVVSRSNVNAVLFRLTKEKKELVRHEGNDRFTYTKRT